MHAWSPNPQPPPSLHTSGRETPNSHQWGQLLKYPGSQTRKWSPGVEEDEEDACRRAAYYMFPRPCWLEKRWQCTSASADHQTGWCRPNSNVVIKNANRMHACIQYRWSETLSVKLRNPNEELHPVRQVLLPPHSAGVRHAARTPARAPHASCPHPVAAPER